MSGIEKHRECVRDRGGLVQVSCEVYRGCQKLFGTCMCLKLRSARGRTCRLPDTPNKLFVAKGRPAGITNPVQPERSRASARCLAPADRPRLTDNYDLQRETSVRRVIQVYAEERGASCCKQIDGDRRSSLIPPVVSSVCRPNYSPDAGLHHTEGKTSLE